MKVAAAIRVNQRRKGADPKRYRRLTVVETVLPAAFFVLSCVLVLCSALS